MRPAIFSLLALLAPLVVWGPAAAQPVQPLDRLLPQIRRTHPGQFYDADGPHPGAGNSQHYHLKWMTPDGRIIWYDTDARTGRVLGSSPGRDNFDSREGYGGPRGGYYAAPPQMDRRGHFQDGNGGGYGGAPGGYGPRGGYGGRSYGGGGGYGARGGYNRGGGGRGGH